MIAKQELEELKRFAELGRVNANLLHEISNPLAAALLHLELSDQDSIAVQRARRTMKLLHRYVKAARQQIRRHHQRSHFYAQPQINQLKPVLIPLARQARVQLMLQPAPRCQLYGNPVRFQQLLANLLTNAIEAYRGAAASRARTVELVWRQQPDCLVMQVKDKGTGIPPGMLPYIFESFVSTKTRSGRGLGLGLANVKRCVTSDFRGTVQAESHPQSGTIFTVRLPLSPLNSR